jgi:hypothetical protein
VRATNGTARNVHYHDGVGADMIVAVYDDDTWFILDNASMVLGTDIEDATRYVPLFVLDKAGVRSY